MRNCCKRASCLRSSPRAWARSFARGSDTSHVGPMARAWAAPTRISRGWRACRGVNAHVQWFMCERYARLGAVVLTTQAISPTTPRCRRLLPRWSALWAPNTREPRPHCPEPRPHRHQAGGVALHKDPCVTCLPMTAPSNGGNCTIRGATRRRHAEGRLLMLQNPPSSSGCGGVAGVNCVPESPASQNIWAISPTTPRCRRLLSRWFATWALHRPEARHRRQ